MASIIDTALKASQKTGDELSDYIKCWDVLK
jgi:hypothetical protein